MLPNKKWAHEHNTEQKKQNAEYISDESIYNHKHATLNSVLLSLWIYIEKNKIIMNPKFRITITSKNIRKEKTLENNAARF